MSAGVVKFFNENKGYGFIIPNSGGEDLFIHCRDLKLSGLRKLEQGQTVTFEVAPGRDGKTKAVNVRLA